MLNSLILNLFNERGEPLARTFIPERITQFFDLGRITELNVAGNFQPNDLTILVNLIEIHINSRTVWGRKATNENIEEPQCLLFKLTQEEFNSLKNYDIATLYRVGILSVELACEGMSALLSQYIADSISGLDFEDINELFNLSENIEYPLDKEPKEEEIIEAIKLYFPESNILKYYNLYEQSQYQE